MTEIIKSKYQQIYDEDEGIQKPSFKLEGSNIFAPRSTLVGPRFQMTVLLLTGVALMLLHHYMNTYINGKAIGSILSMSTLDAMNISDQRIISFAGNSIAYAARLVLSTAVGIVFIQVLWSRIRRKPCSVKEIDAMIDCRGGPFTLSAVPVWHHAFLLALIAALAALMAIISLVTPGSLRVQTLNFGLPERNCTVQTPSLATSNISITLTLPNGTVATDSYIQPRILKLAARVLMNGAPLPPPNPCPGPCQYNITFDAPSMQCNPADGNFDIEEWLPPAPNSSVPFRVWSAGSYPTYFIATTRDLETRYQSAVNCSVYRSTYGATVTHNSTSTVKINDVVSHNLLFVGNWSSDPVNVQYYTLTNAMQNTLYGDVSVDLNIGGSLSSYSDNNVVAYSPAFSGTSESPWAPTIDLGAGITSYMQNLSISFLNADLSQEGNSTTAPFDTECWHTASTYEYNSAQLLGTYGAALGATAICILIGLHAIRLNGVEESHSFSRILGAILNNSLFEDRYQLTSASRLTASGSSDGQLRLVHTTYG